MVPRYSCRKSTDATNNIIRYFCRRHSEATAESLTSHSCSIKRFVATQADCSQSLLQYVSRDWADDSQEIWQKACKHYGWKHPDTPAQGFPSLLPGDSLIAQIGRVNARLFCFCAVQRDISRYSFVHREMRTRTYEQAMALYWWDLIWNFILLRLEEIGIVF